MRLELLVFALVFGFGCSAIVSPDESRLGGGPDAAGDGAVGDGGDSSASDTGDDAEPDGGGCALGCDDGVPCTVDACRMGACTSTPNDGACAAGLLCDPVLGCVTPTCARDADCDDGAFCNGDERCDAGAPDADARGCVAGTPVVCDDGATCTADVCDEDEDACTSAPDDTACGDGLDCTIDLCIPDAGGAGEDGCTHEEDDGLCVSTDFCRVNLECDASAGGCGGGRPRDCGDADACTTDTCDSALGMCIHTGRDADGDGYDATRIGGTVCATGTDCNDGDASVHPGATELCNGRDDDCDGVIDELCTPIPDTCSDAAAIPVVVGGGVTTLSGHLGDFASNYNTVCGATGGRDAVYYVDVTTTVDLTIDTIGSDADTVVAVATTCSGAGFNALGCDDDIERGVIHDSRVWVHRFGPRSGETRRRLYILVDGYNSAATGDFILNVSATAATADSCAAPIDISGGGGLVGFVAPSPLGVIGPRGSCQGFGDGSLTEAIARFSGPSDGTATFNVYSNFFDPDIYVRRGSCAFGTEIACTAGDGTGAGGFRYHTGLTAGTTAGSTYFLFVDGIDTASAYLVSFEP
jgi:hypothetical protein